MKNLKFVLIEQDNTDQILNVKGIYSYKEVFEILESGFLVEMLMRRTEPFFIFVGRNLKFKYLYIKQNIWRKI